MPLLVTPFCLCRSLESDRSVTVIVTLVIIGGLIAFVVLEQQILDALSPAAKWLRE